MSILNKAVTTGAQGYEILEIVCFLGIIECRKGTDMVDMKGLAQCRFHDPTLLTTESIALACSSTLPAPVAAIPFTWNRPASPSRIARTASQFTVAFGTAFHRAIDMSVNLRQLPLKTLATYFADDFTPRPSCWTWRRGRTFPATVFAMGTCAIVRKLFSTELTGYHPFVHAIIIPHSRGFVNHTGRQP